MSDVDFQRRIDELEQQVSELKQTLRAFASGEIDTVVDDAGSTPFLLLSAQAKLQANELLFRAVFDSALDAMLIADDVGRYVDANPAACVLFGLSKAELLGRRIAEFSPPEYPAAAHWEAFIRDGRSRGEFPLLRPDGERRQLEFSAVAGVLPGVNLSILRDVTQRNASENALRQSEHRLRTVIANAPLILFTFDREGIFTFHEGKALESAGLLPGQLVGQSVFTRQKGQQLGGENDLRRALSGEQVASQFESGGKIFDCTLVPKRRDDGTIIGVIGVAMDVSARKAAEVALRASEARFRAMIEQSRDGITLLDAEIRTIYQSPAVQRLLGYTEEEAKRIAWQDFVDVDERPRMQAALARLMESPSATISIEFRIRRHDGERRWLELTATNLLHDPDVGALVSNFRDITARKVAEAGLREAELRFRRLCEAGIIGVTVSDPACGVLEANDAFLELVGYSRADLEAGRLNTLAITPPELLPAQVGITGELDVTGKTGPWEKEYFRKDGTRVPVLVCAAKLDKDRILTVVVDLSEQRRAVAALRATEEQLRQAQKMEAIGSLAGGVAHDFNNLLSVILSYTDLIIEDLKPLDPLRADLEEVHKAGLRATELTRQLLAFSRRQVLQPVVLDVNEVVGGVEKMLARLLGENVTLVVSQAPNGGKVYADPSQLEQVIMNLAINARDAMPRGGRVTIETANLDVDAKYAADHVGIGLGSYVLLCVTDTGTGMDAATKARAFEPFFTTKDKSKGTGLGLSTVYGIVEQSGGHITLDTELGKGSTFRVYLPRTDREVARSLPPLPQFSTLRGTETILLVEDEEQVRTIMCSILRKHGYQVLDAANGGEAFLLSEQFERPINMLLSDVVMPRMSGPQLAARLKASRPEMTVLFVSGYTDDAVVHHGVREGGVQLLEKPIMPDALLRRVRQVLDAKTPAPASSR